MRISFKKISAASIYEAGMFILHIAMLFCICYNKCAKKFRDIIISLQHKKPGRGHYRVFLCADCYLNFYPATCKFNRRTRTWMRLFMFCIFSTSTSLLYPLMPDSCLPHRKIFSVYTSSLPLLVGAVKISLTCFYYCFPTLT